MTRNQNIRRFWQWKKKSLRGTVLDALGGKSLYEYLQLLAVIADNTVNAKL